MKSLRTNPPKVRTHGLRTIGKIKPKHEHEWCEVEHYTEPEGIKDIVKCKCASCDKLLFVTFDWIARKTSRRVVNP